MESSIVEYFAEHEGYKCGYCKGQDTNYSHGMWAHTLITEDYEGLLNRGFRRSGKYLYKPTNSITCCPSYTINLHALEFQLTKSQKKVIKRMNRFLTTGEFPNKSQPGGEEGKQDQDGIDLHGVEEPLQNGGESIKEEVNYKETGDIDMSLVTSEGKKGQRLNKKRTKEKTARASASNGLGSSQLIMDSAAKPQQRKAKQVRLERKRLKLIAQGKLNESESLKSTNLAKSQNQEKSIEMLIEQDQGHSNLKKKLVLKLLYTKSPEFEATFALEHKIYQKYQTVIHNDSEDECSEKQFRRFLCDTPLTKTDADYDGLEGSFHQQYWLDSELIGVGVIDILPHILSSVYFFYDPKYSFLSLGNYGALREITFARKLHQTQPDLQFYYMGYYIHACRKMRYKGAYIPSYLLCPEKFSWVRLDDDLRKRLDQTKYQRLDTRHDDASGEPRKHNIQAVQIFFRQCVLPYPIYELKRGSSDREQIQQYCDLVGDEVASQLLLYRS